MKHSDDILKKAVYCRLFEKKVQELLLNKTIQIPTYLSIGQEMIPAVMSEYFSNFKLFGQLLRRLECMVIVGLWGIKYLLLLGLV
jgi:hypothetical protein